MLKNKYKIEMSIISSACFVVSLAVVLFIQGSIPFLSIPTLGQAIWTTGFSQSFANSSIFTIHATNFGNPEPSAIAFGLAGAYPASLLIRLGLHPADAYSLMAAIWLFVAFVGAWKIARAFKLSAVLCALTSTLWLSMPIVWWHARYSMLSIGISLLPLYFFMSLRVLQCFGDNYKTLIRFAGLYLLMAIIAIFMDGYSFMMFVVSSSIMGGYSFWRFPENRRTILKFSLPVQIISFSLAYFLYTSYIGKTQFKLSSLNFFRGWGADLMFFAVPSQGVHWLWDSMGVSLARNGHEQFGDASVWSTTFALPIIIFGIFSWWRVRRKSMLATGFLLVALFGFYMGMGPSLKLNSIKPEGVTARGMTEEYAVVPLGNAWLSKHIPGFMNMRAAYRWSAMGFLGLWFLIVLRFSIEQKNRFKWIFVCFTIFIIVSNVPDMKKKFLVDCSTRDSFYNIEDSIVRDLSKVISKGERVSFLPYRNDFLVNYLASRTNINSYNIGGDKNLLAARKHWPRAMTLFKMGRIDENFVPNVIQLLVQQEADVVVLPHIDLLQAAHSWPMPLKFKKQIDSVVAKLSNSDLVAIDERFFYTIVRLRKNN